MANTTNLNLEKIAGSDKLNTFPTPYNSNMDKIDTWAGTTNSDKANAKGLGYNSSVVSCATNAEIETAIANAVSVMENNQSAILRVNITATSLHLSGGYWNITVFRGTASYYSATCQSYADTVVYYLYSNGTKTWDSFALNSKLNEKIAGTAGTNSGQVQTFTFTDDNGAKMRLTVAKLDASNNYLQVWLGDNLTDRGYIKFDVSRNIT